mmetsp:Transcript_37655/g.76851  ORF Transcript_37655/g.76851 Transcript_37655/m.76851 type:complete len:347 (-) Transcript_37655:35-1075(-)
MGRLGFSTRTQNWLFLASGFAVTTVVLRILDAIGGAGLQRIGRGGGGSQRKKNLRLECGTGAADEVNSRLIGPPDINDKYQCGKVKDGRDCPRWYEICDIVLSSSAAGGGGATTTDQSLLDRQHEAAVRYCAGEDKRDHTPTGGWCLTPDARRNEFVEFGDDVKIPMSESHVPPSDRVVSALSDLVTREGVASVNDFGAGIGQYKAEMLAEFPGLEYRAYDGAGNVEEYTRGFVSYFDMTLPLELPKADWVLSLEVGEHVPTRYEGMVIRNMHHHNCKGVILSWGVPLQIGHGHINLHSNDYITDTFEQLGYTRDNETEEEFRQQDGNYWWFEKSLMVFRRKSSVC